MSYDINLYRPELLPPPVELGASTIFRLLLALLLALALSAVLESWQIRRFHAALIEAEHEQVAAEKQLQDYSLRYPPLKIDESLQAKVADIERALRGKHRMLRLVEGGKKQKSPGFARYLAGFSRQHVRGLWLEQIHVHTYGNLFIAGSVMDAGVLPIYLERLAGDSAFADHHFQGFNIIQPGQFLLHQAVDVTSAATHPTAPGTDTATPIPGSLRFDLRATGRETASGGPS